MPTTHSAFLWGTYLTDSNTKRKMCMPSSLQNLNGIKQQSSLFHIKGKKFTKREIDVIACLVCGPAASIPRFLSISARTVETHIHNIMLKLACKTRADIIEFVEQSKELRLIHQHYQSLVGDILFVKALKAIATFVKAKKRTCVLFFEQSASMNDAGMIHKIINHFSILNMNVTRGNHNEPTPFYISVSADTAAACPAFSLFILSQEEYEAQGGVGGADATATVWQIYMRLDQSDSSEEGTPVTDMKTTFCACSTYYDAVFTISKELYPTHNIDTFITDFNTQYEALGYDNTHLFSTETQSTIHVPATWRTWIDQRLRDARTYVFLFIRPEPGIV